MQIHLRTFCPLFLFDQLDRNQAAFSSMKGRHIMATIRALQLKKGCLICGWYKISLVYLMQVYLVDADT